MTESPTEHHATPNRLAREKSPYLLQHANNPVDWYPWGEEAFAKARREDKPVFLSIGYSTCHWCHVMERESFEDGGVAALLNEHFVPVKVDREERPDVDRLYMTAMQAMGMGGGWPLTVFLAPSLEPFFGGTYFPRETRGGHPGMLQLLPHIHRAWIEQREAIDDTGRQVMEALESLGARGAAEAEEIERSRLLDGCFHSLAAAEDDEKGGFGRAPKFPSVANLDFLIRYWARDPRAHAAAREMVLRQLDAMRAGGIHDHLGGGFHRYSTDREWLVPHFEKMLYDQAQLAWACLEAHQVTGRTQYAETARGIFDYVARDLTSPDGAFYSAEDADSEGVEGRFYVWTPAELTAVLGDDDARIFAFRYGVTEEGNFEHAWSILHEARTPDDTAREFGLSVESVVSRLAAARTRLLEARASRVRPHRDDKVLTSWNGLMISAFARGARVLAAADLARRAERAATFVWERMFDSASGALHRRWREGEAAGAGQLDDFADLALGLIDLYGATFDPIWLVRATRIVEAAIDRFWDEKDGGFFESAAGDPTLRVRMKSDFDGAELAGGSIMALDLVTLAALLDRDDWREKARRALDYHARRLSGHSAAMPQMLVAMEMESARPRHIVIAGPADAEDTRDMIAAFNRRFLPHDALMLVDGVESRAKLATLAPFAARLPSVDGRATAYVCVDYACRLPATDPAAFAAQLDEGPPAPIAAEPRS
jgi:hypothetical protein